LDVKSSQVPLCRDGQEYKRTVPISGSINPFGQIRILPLIALSHIGSLLSVRSATINGQLSTPWTIINHDSRNTRSVNRRFYISTSSCRKLFPAVCFPEKHDYLSRKAAHRARQRRWTNSLRNRGAGESDNTKRDVDPCRVLEDTFPSGSGNERRSRDFSKSASLESGLLFDDSRKASNKSNKINKQRL